MKLCGKCKISQPEENFGWKNKERGWRQPWCKPCNRAYQKQHYVDNKAEYIKKARVWDSSYYDGIYAKLKAYFDSNPCVDCGTSDARVLEFDHVRGKKSHNISDMIRNKVSWKKIQEEIVKCDVRCANCHKIITYERANSRRSLWL